MLANKGRTILTTLGIVIGITAVIVVYSAGSGVSNLVIGQVESFGTDIIETEIKVPSDKKGQAAEFESANDIARGVQITTLTLDDMDSVSGSANVKNAYAGLMGQEVVYYRSQTRKAYLFGTSASYNLIDKSRVDQGRFFTEAEDRSLAQVAVLGSKMKDKLFGQDDPIGKSITIRKQKFEIIGVMEERGAVMFVDYDDYIYIPVRVMQKKIMGVDYISYMVHQLVKTDSALDTAEEARFLIRQNHRITNPDRDDFRVVTMTEALDSLRAVTNAVTWLLLGIVIISLIVGGVGVMNVMYVVVSERTAEIGLRKAVGATTTDILLQFLIESVMVTLLGGMIGTALGWLASYAVAFGADRFGLDWKFVIPAQAYITAFIFSLVCGVLFGLYPARAAAKLDPIEALRNE